MDQRQTMRGSFDPRQIQQGCDVYGSDGDKIGDVSEVHEQYLVISKGFLGTSERFVPFSAVSRIERDRVELNVTKDEIDQRGWDKAPETSGWIGPRPERTTAEREMRTERERSIPLHEEQLRPRKETVQTGEVELRKEVRSEQKTMDVPVTREEVYVERHPVDTREAERFDAGEIGEGETIRVPVREERVEVEKRPVVYEEVEIGKRRKQDTERITDTVRREEPRLDREGEVDLGGSGRSDWDAAAPRFRQQWERRSGSTGERWEEAEPYHHYGYEMANDPRYHGRNWDEIEPELRSNYADWSRRKNYRYDENDWDRYRQSTRETWQGARSPSRR
jgi:uncharacterized protein (TIGR02271 family)